MQKPRVDKQNSPQREVANPFPATPSTTIHRWPTAREGIKTRLAEASAPFQKRAWNGKGPLGTNAIRKVSADQGGKHMDQPRKARDAAWLTWILVMTSLADTEGRMCENLPYVRFGRPSSLQAESKRYRANEDISYICEIGFKFDPDVRVVTCHTNGSWSQPPNCEPVTCEWRRTLPEGGAIVIRRTLRNPLTNRLTTDGALVAAPSGPRFYMYNSVAFLSCQRGFALADGQVASTRCDETGRWTSPAPSCKRTLCRVPRYPLNGIFVTRAGQAQAAVPGVYVPFEVVVTSRCRLGYAAAGIAQAMQDQKCTESGAWSAIEPCQPIACTAPLSVPDADILAPRYSYGFGDYVTYSCRTGYRFPSGLRVNAFCSASGHWSPIGRCQRITCPVETGLRNGRMVVDGNGAGLGSSARYLCNPGSVLMGEALRRCAWDGTWSGEEPTCRNCGDIIGNTSRPATGQSAAAMDVDVDVDMLSQRPFRWQAALWTKRPRGGGGNDPNLICTGAMVHKRFVLVAAQCLENLTHYDFRTGLAVVRFGDMTSSSSSSSRDERRIWAVHRHPDFDARTQASNLALLVLHKRVRFGATVSATASLGADEATMSCLTSPHGQSVVSRLSQRRRQRRGDTDVRHDVRSASVATGKQCRTAQRPARNEKCVRLTRDGGGGGDGTQDCRGATSSLLVAHDRRKRGDDAWTLTGILSSRHPCASERSAVTWLGPARAWLNDIIKCEQSTSRAPAMSRCACLR